MHERLAELVGHRVIVVEPGVCELGPSDAGRARTHDDTDALRAEPGLQVLDIVQESVLVQAEPGELVIAAVQMLETGRQRYGLDSFDATDPRVEVAAVEIVSPEAGTPLRYRVPHCGKAGTGGRSRCV